MKAMYTSHVNEQEQRIALTSSFKHFGLTMVLSVFLMTGWTGTATAHNELLATFLVESYDGQVYVKAIVEKRHITAALEQEGDCQPADMMSKCGEEYITEHLQLSINGVTVSLAQLSMDIEQENVTYLFKVKGEFPQVKKVALVSDYMFDYNEHAILRAVIGLGDEPKSYTLRPGASQLHYYAT